ncbi:MAG: RidA family protein [Nitrospinota bacterium]
MTRRAINPASIGAPVAPYSHAILTEGREILFLAGQVPIDKEGNTVGVGDFEAQARCVFDLLGEVLKEAGMGWTNVAKLNLFLTRREDREKITALREELFPRFFPDGDYPISTLLFISGLYREEFLIEIEAIAVR